MGMRQRLGDRAFAVLIMSAIRCAEVRGILTGEEIDTMFARHRRSANVDRAIRRLSGKVHWACSTPIYRVGTPRTTRFGTPPALLFLPIGLA